jgi:hypothetical protein
VGRGQVPLLPRPQGLRQAATRPTSTATLKKKPDEPVADYSKAIDEYKALLKEFPNYGASTR